MNKKSRSVDIYNALQSRLIVIYGILLQLLALQKLKSIINPARTDTRVILHKHYGVPLPCKLGQKDDLNKVCKCYLTLPVYILDEERKLF